MIKALVGLGNTGPEYATTYHNVGAFVAEQLTQCEEGQTPLSMLKHYPLSGFMNESGGPVRLWLKENNLTIDDCLVIHDDSDLLIGDYKLVKGGSSAGHKGVESLVSHLGTEDFWRLRIGIRDPKEEVRRKAGEFVLRHWSANDERYFREVIAKTCPAVAGLATAPTP